MMKKFLPLFIVLLLALIFVIAYLSMKNSASLEVDFHATEYTGAEKCQDCHQKNYDSWKKTYHRTMTQEATEDSVLGNFDGSNLTYWGITIRPTIQQGKYYFEYYNPESGEFLTALEIKRTVGSRRYQQYLAQTDNTQGNYYRLELLWHIEDQRWVHLNGAFLGTDNQAFDSHTSIWNQNCIFCHNTGINPNMTNYDEIIQQTKQGKPLNFKRDSRFQSHVSDLGIGCESCHANGAQHIALNQNPLRKYYLNFTKADDKSIINPTKLSAKSAMDICGQCHGQRTPKTYKLARKWMEEGPTYRPGDVLQSHVNPVWKESIINTRQSDIFKQRFWQDGTPRLTAYEYQGLLQSECHIKGNLTCNDCHSMHDGNPKGMITDENLTNIPCLNCHTEYKNSIAEHTGHREKSEGSLCYNCHMSKTVYGIMTFHRSHKIESPNPEIEFSTDKPNACVACHIDKSSQWIMQESLNIWPNLNSSKQQKNNLIQSIYKLHSGDPVERSIAATRLSYRSSYLNNSKKRFLIPHLLYSMEDNYPAVRRFSWKSLMSLTTEMQIEKQSFEPLNRTLKSFDFIADSSLRNRIVKNAWQQFNALDKSDWSTPPPGSLVKKNYAIDFIAIENLRKLSKIENKKIEIGE